MARPHIAEEDSRSTKQTRRVGQKPKFAEARIEEIKQNALVPMNEKQRDYMRMVENMDMVIATGYAGTSKTYIPTVMACDWFRCGRIKKIVFTRPNISNSRSLGMFKGDLIEKMSQWLMPVISILRERIGDGALEIALKRGDIEFVPMEVLKGYSAQDCVFIVDEAEDLTIEEAKKVVTRQGKNCKMILAGDVSQSELKEKSGLKKLIEMIDKYPTLNVGVVDFNNINDIVRSDQCKNWIIAWTKEEKS
jgi:phosphate starvation-inducible PhoH-like protein